MMEVIGSKVLNYNVISLIGEGGMASVYMGEHERLGTKVAIKVLHPILSTNAQIKDRFLNEAKLMATLDHPNITKVLDFEETGSVLCLVMEYLDGEDMSELIKRKGSMSIENIDQIYSQVLSAFQYAHLQGIVHRDIKPSNIFIRKDGVVKILDFGIAKLFGQGNEMTQTGTQIGTPIFMSPEQVKGDKSIDFRSDIYSLGITLYYASYGQAPYDSNTLSQFDILSKIVHEPLPMLDDHPLKGIILTACSKDRENRFQSCEEWMIALKNTVNQVNGHQNQSAIASSTQRREEIPVLSSEGHVGHFVAGTTSNASAVPGPQISNNPETPKISRVKVGNQIWMAENLRVTHFLNGDAIQECNSNSAWAEASEKEIPAFSKVFESSNKFNFIGYLYNWYALSDPRGIAPKGWKIPSKFDFETLINTIGGQSKAANLKHHQGWTKHGGHINEFIKIPPCGNLDQFGEYKKIGERAGIWGKSDDDIYNNNAYSMILTSLDHQIRIVQTEKGRGLLVRCIQL